MMTLGPTFGRSASEGQATAPSAAPGDAGIKWISFPIRGFLQIGVLMLSSSPIIAVIITLLSGFLPSTVRSAGKFEGRLIIVVKGHATQYDVTFETNEKREVFAASFTEVGSATSVSLVSRGERWAVVEHNLSIGATSREARGATIKELRRTIDAPTTKPRMERKDPDQFVGADGVVLGTGFAIMPARSGAAKALGAELITFTWWDQVEPTAGKEPRR